MEGILCRRRLVNATTYEEVLQRSAEGLYRREEHTAVADGIALNIVEVAVGVCLQVVIQTVTTQTTQQQYVLGLLFRDITDVDTCSVALILDIQTELLLLNIGGQIVDVLHHQRPVGLMRIIRRILQRLDEESFLGSGVVGSKLTHTVRLTAIGKLIGHSQHLISL